MQNRTMTEIFITLETHCAYTFPPTFKSLVLPLQQLHILWLKINSQCVTHSFNVLCVRN